MESMEAEQAAAAALQDQETNIFQVAAKKKKRNRPVIEDDEEVQRLRDKNRTNSKRFRDRKKTYMDSLFEEKYRLGKRNNDLRDDNEKLRFHLHEAAMENKRHRQNVARGLYNVQPDRMGPPGPGPALMAGMASYVLPTPSLSNARLQQSTSLEGGLIAARASRSLPPYFCSNTSAVNPALLDLMGEVEAQKRERMLKEFALRDLEASIHAKMGNAGAVNSKAPLQVHSSYYRRML